MVFRFGSSVFLLLMDVCLSSATSKPFRIVSSLPSLPQCLRDVRPHHGLSALLLSFRVHRVDSETSSRHAPLTRATLHATAPTSGYSILSSTPFPLVLLSFVYIFKRVLSFLFRLTETARTQTQAEFPKISVRFPRQTPRPRRPERDSSRRRRYEFVRRR